MSSIQHGWKYPREFHPILNRLAEEGFLLEPGGDLASSTGRVQGICLAYIQHDPCLNEQTALIDARNHSAAELKLDVPFYFLTPSQSPEELPFYQRAKILAEQEAPRFRSKRGALDSRWYKSAENLGPEDRKHFVRFTQLWMTNPLNPAFQLERLRNGSESNLWSARLSLSLRAIVYFNNEDALALYAGQHDDAYRWAERRSVRRGALGIIEVIDQDYWESEILEPEDEAAEDIVDGILSEVPNELLISMGVPEACLKLLKKATTEDQLLRVCDQLPDYALEKVLRYYMYGEVEELLNIGFSSQNESPEAAQVFIFPESDEDLERFHNAPNAAWMAFLHPDQRELVKKKTTEPVLVRGAAGTGKTVVGLHRAKHLLENGEYVLLTSFSPSLCRNLELSLTTFFSFDEMTKNFHGKFNVCPIEDVAEVVMTEANGFPCRMASQDQVFQAVTVAMSEVPIDKLPRKFRSANALTEEWNGIVQAQGLTTWDSYMAASRKGRGAALSTEEKKILWDVFTEATGLLNTEFVYPTGQLLTLASLALKERRATLPYTAVIVDEVQDLTAPHLRFIREIADQHLGNLMLLGDPNQRIFPGGFKLEDLGIKVHGRTSVLKLNYRSTKKILDASNTLLSREEDDFSGGSVKDALRVISKKSGEPIRLKACSASTEEVEFASDMVRDWRREGIDFSDIAIFARTEKLYEGVCTLFKRDGIPLVELGEKGTFPGNHVTLGSMHDAKGLEFTAVLLVGCSNENIPFHETLGAMVDEHEKEEFVKREQRLFYVALTRARTKLAVAWVGSPTESLRDIQDQVRGHRGGAQSLRVPHKVR